MNRKLVFAWLLLAAVTLTACHAGPAQTPASHGESTSSASESTSAAREQRTSEATTSGTTATTTKTNPTTSQTNTTTSTRKEINYEDYPSEFILTTTQKEYPVDVKEIVCTMENPTEKHLDHVEPFELQRLVNKKWENVPFKEDGGRFYKVLYHAPPKSTQTKTYNMEWRFDLPLQPGEYRIVQDASGYVISNTFHIQ